MALKASILQGIELQLLVEIKLAGICTISATLHIIKIWTNIQHYVPASGETENFHLLSHVEDQLLVMVIQVPLVIETESCAVKFEHHLHPLLIIRHRFEISFSQLAKACTNSVQS